MGREKGCCRFPKMLTILQGDCIERLRELPEASVHCCVTSPPYWGLRDYGVDGQIGLEETPDEWVRKMSYVFGLVWRVLRDDGTLWLNLGDTYASAGGCGYQGKHGERSNRRHTQRALVANKSGVPAKNLLGLPWRAALALQADGWCLRSDIIWHKPNPMPESVTDRPTKAHEYLFLLSKSERYYYDAEAIKEPVNGGAHARRPGNVNPPKGQKAYENGDHLQRTKAGLLAYAQKRGKGGERVKYNDSFANGTAGLVDERNKRTVWTVGTFGFPGAHFATYPPDLIKPCILAGCPVGGTVLDPFAGSGTTGAVALELGRKAVLIELNPDYVQLIRQRCAITPGLQFPNGNPEAPMPGHQGA